MNKFGFLTALFVSAMTLFTSCLGEGGNEASFSATGIVFMNEKAGFKPMLDIGSAVLNVPQMATRDGFIDGKCWSVAAHVDYNSPDNVDWGTKGYLTAALSGEPVLIDQCYAMPIQSESDTTVVMDGEVPLVSAFQPSMFNNYVRGWLIFPSTLKVGSKQTLSWSLVYPEVKAEEKNGISYYNIYLRVTASGDATGASNNGVVNAFYLKDYLDRINVVEKSAGHTQYTLRFNYVSEIQKETNKLIWKYDEAAMAVMDNTQK